jgi:uncharacterized Fe-S cluster protein YjdI
MSSEVEKDDVTVIWDKSKCIHAALCVGGLPQVFKPSEKRWIQVENATKEEIIAQVNKCPSGALSMK